MLCFSFIVKNYLLFRPITPIMAWSVFGDWCQQPKTSESKREREREREGWQYGGSQCSEAVQHTRPAPQTSQNNTANVCKYLLSCEALVTTFCTLNVYINIKFFLFLPVLISPFAICGFFCCFSSGNCRIESKKCYILDYIFFRLLETLLLFSNEYLCCSNCFCKLHKIS